MKLESKKDFAARTLGVGKGRIIFNNARLDELKEAMTRQDIKDLFASGAISIKDVGGRKTIVKRKTRRRAGSKRKSIVGKKRRYITITRKLRRYLSELRNNEDLSEEHFQMLRKEIRASRFIDKSHLKDRIKLLSVKQ